MSRGIEDEGVSLDQAFREHVMQQELEALALRSAAETRTSDAPAGLPDFDDHLRERERASPFFLNLLDRLTDPAQDEVWRKWVAGSPSDRHGGLTGIALSGGGIRSATLNLGIVQVVHRIGLFRCLDYLSTVSGGGYLGSSISACYALDAPEDGDKLAVADEKFPYQHVRGRPESLAFLQLRNFSKFLVPRGLFDYLRLFALLLRGVVLNLLVILPWIVGLALVTRLLLVESAGAWVWRWDSTAWWPGAAASFGTTALLAVILGLLIVLFPVARWFQVRDEGIESTRRFRNLYERSMAGVLLLIPVAAWVEVQPEAIGVMLSFGGELPEYVAGGVGALSGLLASATHLFANDLRSLVRRYAVYLVAALGFVAFWLLYLVLVSWILDEPDWWTVDLPVEAAAGVVLAVLAFYSLMFIDANGLSLHNFYRDRLAQAFLFKVEDGEISDQLDLKLTQLSRSIGPLHLINTAINTRRFPQRFRKGRRADPFFLSPVFSGSRTTGYCRTENLESLQPDLSVAAAMATSGAAVSSNMASKGNAAMRVILSMLNIRLGYWLVNPYHLAPGRRGGLAFLLGRLLGVGVARFIQELTGWLDYKRSFVYLSDGGHIENMGIYPLVHRQCRLIIVGDGECDPAYTFEGLLDALRMISVDFGVEIEMDGLDEIRSGMQQHALGTIHYPDGRLGYLLYFKSSLLGDDMIEATVSEEAYVSSPLRSDVRHFDELGYIARYKAAHPEFPHETTADQFFDEAQFECYRALGYLIADRAFTGK